MGAVLQIICLAGHGGTAWSLSGQHTGLTDLLLTEHGELNAQSLGRRLRGFAFTKVLTSPLRRAVRTCELAGFGTEVEADRNLLEWNYVQYERRKPSRFANSVRAGNCFATVVPTEKHRIRSAFGPTESWTSVRNFRGNVLFFSSGHFLRVLAARWLGLDAGAGRLFTLDPASQRMLGYEHNLSEPAIRLWNDARHVEDRLATLVRSGQA
jgi:broad specificity phosphatase PhoE